MSDTISQFSNMQHEIEHNPDPSKLQVAHTP